MAMMTEIVGAGHEIAKDGHIHRERIEKAAEGCLFAYHDHTQEEMPQRIQMENAFRDLD